MFPRKSTMTSYLPPTTLPHHPTILTLLVRRSATPASTANHLSAGYLPSACASSVRACKARATPFHTASIGRCWLGTEGSRGGILSFVLTDYGHAACGLLRVAGKGNQASSVGW